MRKFKLKQVLASTLLCLSVVSLGWADTSSKRLAFNEIAAEIPFDGGGMLMLSRFWRINRFMKAGFTVGGGVIEREFELDGLGLQDWDAETKALVLPYFGPRITAGLGFIGLSLVYGFYYAKTDIDISRSGTATLTGDKSAWGTGFYSPFIVLDFYSQKYDIFFGLGLGGFLGGHYPDIEATNGTSRIKTDASPIDTLTFSIRTTWTNRRKPMPKEDDADNYFDE